MIVGPACSHRTMERVIDLSVVILIITTHLARVIRDIMPFRMNMTQTPTVLVGTTRPVASVPTPLEVRKAIATTTTTCSTMTVVWRLEAGVVLASSGLPAPLPVTAIVRV